MSTLLDVLRLEIELQSEKFVKGQRELQDSFDKLGKDLIKGGKQVEDQHRKTADSIGSVSRELQGMFGLLKGGMAAEALNFLKGFSAEIAAATAGLGRLSSNIGAQPQELNAWGLAVERIGGNAQTAMSYILGLSSKLAAMQRGHMLPSAYQELSSMGGVPLDYQASPMDFFQAVIKNLQNVAADPRPGRGRPQAFSLGQGISLDEGSFNLIMQGGKQLDESLAAVRNILVRPEDIKAATKLQATWEELRQTMEALNREAVTAAEGPLNTILQSIIGFVRYLRGEDSSDIKRHIHEETGGGPFASSRPYYDYYKRFHKSKFNWMDPFSWGRTIDREHTSSPWAHSGEDGAAPLDRSRFAKELQDNALLREKIMSISAGENLDPAANQAVMESMMNRAAMMGTSLAFEARLTGEGGYYAGYQPGALRDPRIRAMIEANLNKTLGGSNVSNYATDNASGGFASGRFSGMYLPTFSAGGETFGYPNGPDARGALAYQNWVSGARLAASQNSVSTVNNSNSNDMRIGAINMYGVQDVSGFSAELQAQANRVGFAFNAQSGAN